VSDLFSDRLQRYLDGELSDAEALELFRQVAEDPEARREFLEAKEMDLEFRRLLNPGGSDAAFIRGVLSAQSKERKDSSTLIRQVMQTYAEEKRRTVVNARRGQFRIFALAAGVLAAIVALVVGLSGKREEQRSGPRQVRNEERPLVELRPEPSPSPAPDRTVSPEPERPTIPAPERDPKPDRKEAEGPEPFRPTPEPKSPEVPPTPSPSAPSPEKDRSKPPSRETAPAKVGPVIARLSVVTGEVHLVSGAVKTRAQAGQTIQSGQGLSASGSLAFAMVTFPDSSSLQVWPETAIRSVSDDPKGAGKRVVMDRGTLAADVVRQPKDRPLVIATPQGEATVLGTMLQVAVDPADAGTTFVDVDEGKVMFAPALNGPSIDLTAGFSMTAASGSAPKVRAPAPQPRKKMTPAEFRVDTAIKNGVEFLRFAPSPGHNGSRDADDLILWTYVHAGVPETDPKFRSLLKKVLEAPLETTYTVSLRAMILEEINRVAYQGLIHRCAQFLVDSQCQNGQWGYGVRTTFPEYPTEVTTPVRERFEVASSAKPTGKAPTVTSPLLRPRPKILQRAAVKKMRDAAASGDNSNSQYAALGLRACHDAGIVFPTEVVERARDWWTGCQISEGTAGGWAYSKGADRIASGAMTAGAVGSMVIYDYMRGSDWKKNPVVQAGINWLAVHFTVTENLQSTYGPARFHYYYLYALERAAIFLGAEQFGRHAWYAEGSKVILDAQKSDGSWLVGTDQATWDTCFAVLFLRRATRPLADVASEDRGFKK
jgi:hypothetical protein